ncbi:MAG: DUF4982 domain-containing protein [Lachnospiraceae bacterium]|nr:DUF4982 domain-containing protein [Lachnospiraceae bacterium]
MTTSNKWNDGWEFLMLKTIQEEDHTKHSSMAAELALSVATKGYATEEQVIDQNKTHFQPVDLPHDYLIENTHALYQTSIGVYRKNFILHQVAVDKEYLLDFDGVYMDCTVFVNGQKAKEWKYGYSAFRVNITKYLKPGENQVVVSIDYREPNSRWYSGAGIYRPVRWVERPITHIATDGIYATEKRTEGDSWKVTISTEVVAKEKEDYDGLRLSLLDSEGRMVDVQCVNSSDEKEISVEQQGEILEYDDASERQVYSLETSFMVENPLLWDIGQGNLYTLQVGLLKGEEILDEQKTRIGFRELTFDAKEGFFINGQNVKINGVCEHHDLGCLGAAFNEKAMLRKLCILSGMGVNAVRSAHNMAAREWVELCDEMGFLMDNEAFDMWERPMTTYDYARFFKDWYKKDVASWIRRDRNHPSLLMWSIGNEIPDTVESEHGREIAQYLVAEVRKHDPRGNAPTTIGSNYMKWDNAILAEKEVELAGYNYSEYLYDEHHERFPEFVIYGSETSSLLESRGIYHFPYSAHVLSDADLQCSALGNTVTGWGGKSYEDVICDDRDRKYSLGQFIWTGFDYIGEPTPYDTKNSYFGQIDTAGFPKDAYYIYQSAWTDYRTKPMVHVFPYWDFNEGEIIDISVCTNAPMVELFVNGVSQGREIIEQGKDRDFVKRYRIPYHKGELKAVCYDEQGAVLAEEVKRSFGDAVCLQADIEDTAEYLYGAYQSALQKFKCLQKESAIADGEDLKFVVIRALDKDGNPVENAKNRVHVSLSGEGRILGMDNGDSTDFDAYKGVSRRLFSGLLLVVIATTKQAGKVTLLCESEGLQSAEVSFTSETIEKDLTGISCASCCKEVPIYGAGVQAPVLDNLQEIPVRRITILPAMPVYGTLEEGLQVVNLTAEQPSLILEAKLYPENTTYKEIEWFVVTDTGIELPYIHLTKIDESKVEVTAKGDGEFRIRCVARNGGNCVSVRSDLQCVATGLGQPFLNPYESVLCGLSTETSSRCEAGIDHGVNFLGANAEEDLCYVGFDNLAFGKYGTDQVKFYIFANTGDQPVTLKLYSGRPGDADSTLLVDTLYHKPPQWMVFQEECISLPKRLKDGDAFYIATTDSYQMRNFVFEKKEKAYECLLATECDALYGDAFTRTEEDIKSIGNNVIIHFAEMDFGTEVCKRVSLTAHTNLQVNPVQIRFTDDVTGTSSVQLIEVKQSSSYETLVYELPEGIVGKGTVDFVFLPGSEIDIKSMQFLK